MVPIAVPVRVAALACALLIAAAHAHAQDRRSARPEPPPHFGPSYRSPYNFAPPAPIYPTPGGGLYDTPYQGGNGYGREPAAPSAAPSRNAPRSQRLDTRIGPAR